MMGWWDAMAGWFTKNPEATAALIGVGGGLLNSATQKKGDIQFKPQPETPQEKALRMYAERLAGVPNAAGVVQPGAMPTYNYLAPQIDNMLRQYGAQSAAYQPLDRLDVATGKPIARAGMPASIAEYNAMPQLWRPGRVGDIGTPVTPDPTLAAPPPPGVFKTDFNDRIRDLGKGAIKGGAQSALLGGPIGGLVGAVGGIFGAKNKYKEKEKKSKAAYQAWVAEYGSQFTDAAGNQVTPPKNLAEYKKWYEMKYGVPYKG